MALRFTRFTNPHNGLYETQKVATLGQGDVQDYIGKEETDSEAIRRLEEYFEGNSLLEEQPRKRFKHGDEHRISQNFRLISSKLPPQPIILEIPLTSVRSRFRSPNPQDSSEQRRLRRAQARTAAIEGGDIITQSTGSRTEVGPVKTFKTSLPIMPAVALLIQEKEPTGVRGKVPIIPTSPHSSDPPSRKKRRRRFKSKPPRLRPAFYRPTPSMGPRATGYALGYRGSWVVEDPSKVPYERDKMRRGRLASLAAFQ